MTDALALEILSGTIAGMILAGGHLGLTWIAASSTIARRSLVPTALGYLARMGLLVIAATIIAFFEPPAAVLVSGLAAFIVSRRIGLRLARVPRIVSRGARS